MVMWWRPWLRRLQVDRAVAFGLLTRVWSLAGGPITVILIAAKFTPELQGYYYTFNSLLGLHAFVELGLTTVITQFASHEWAHLAIHPETGRIHGDADARSRLISIGRLGSAWFGIAAAVALVGLGVGGYIFFSFSDDHGIAWRGPWIALCVLSAANLFLLPVFSLLEGCQQVSAVYGYRLAQVVLSSVVAWTVMLQGGGLWAPAAFHGVSLSAAVVFLAWRYRRFLQPLLHPVPGPAVGWRAEILPMQWRLGVGYLFSYFTFGVFTPLTFHYGGAVAAGQMGLTMTLVAMVGAMASVWPSARAPQFGMLIARKAYHELDRLFLRVALIAEGVLLAGGLAVWLTIVGLAQIGHPFAARLLPPLPALLLVGGMVFSNLCGPMTVYMRAHKREPYVALSVAVAVLTGLSAWVMAVSVGPTGIAAAYLVISAFIGFPAGLMIFVRRRREWHAE